jgi:hypothetical protein
MRWKIAGRMSLRLTDMRAETPVALTATRVHMLPNIVIRLHSRPFTCPRFFAGQAANGSNSGCVPKKFTYCPKDCRHCGV